MYSSVSSWLGSPPSMSSESMSLSSESASSSSLYSSCSMPSVLDQLRVVDAVASSSVVHNIVDAVQHLQLHDDQQVRWFSQVLCHGLSLELNEHATVKSCVNVYCRWLDALLIRCKEEVEEEQQQQQQLGIKLPQVIKDDPNVYARLACRHLVKLFLPRRDDFGQESIQKQAVLCHRVLRKIQDVAHQSQILENDTWNALLIFLLEVNQALLAPPATPDDVGEQLCERVLSALVSVWLISCVKSFPLPSLWKSFRQLAMQWRHRIGVVDMWNKVCLALTKALIHNCYGAQFGKSLTLQPSLEISDDITLPKDMSPDCIAQTWFRFLHTLGPPNELSEAWAVSQTQHFYQYAIEAQQVVDPSQHPCLNHLPAIFHKAMKGVAALVDAFLGLPKAMGLSRSTSTTSTASTATAHQPLHQSTLSLHSVHSGPVLERPALSSDRSSVNSLLHLFGRWLLDSLINTSKKNATALDLKEEDRFESGRAEAAGTLCRILCSKKTDEHVNVAYLTQFYEALHTHLQSSIVSEVGVMVVVNCEQQLLQLDLQGVHILLPDLLNVLEIVLQSENESRVRMPNTINRMQLRRSAIKMLGSMLPLPSHFQNLPVLSLEVNVNSGDKKEVTFQSLRPRMVSLVISALQLETDPMNIHMLLGGLMFLISDGVFLHDDVNSQSKPVLKDASLGVHIRALHLVCQRLISHWKSELNASLAALEFLSAMAMLQISSQDSVESVRVITWICEFIVVQCSKPPQYHSKDLHSTIVAAFKCLNTWILYHKHCLKDRTCLITIIEVAELGISGSKSSNSNNSNVVLKNEKKLNPASGRVRDSAEILLTTLMEQVNDSDAMGADEVDERSLVMQITGKRDVSLEQAVPYFDYFCIDTAILVAVMKDEFMVDQGDTPNVYVVIRTAWSGRFAWQMRLQQVNRSLAVDKDMNREQGRPYRAQEGTSEYNNSEITTTTTSTKHTKKFFPDDIERIPLCKADRSIPSSESVATTQDSSEMDEVLMDQLDNLSVIVAKQIELEKRHHMCHTNIDQDTMKPPQRVQKFQSARLLLNHLGLIAMASSESHHDRYSGGRLLRLQTSGLVENLRRLDNIKTCLLVEQIPIFYVKKGQRNREEICNNQLSGSVCNDSTFVHFLHSLGNFDGNSNEYRWSDKQAEISFVFADRMDKDELKQVKLAILWMESLDDAIIVQQALIAQRSEVERTKSDDRSTTTKTTNMTSSLLGSGCSLLLLQPTTSGLIRVRMPPTTPSKMLLGTPLVDGLSVRGDSVGWLTRQTALNVAMRWRLSRTIDGPQSRRKTLVQEICDKHRQDELSLIPNLF